MRCDPTDFVFFHRLFPKRDLSEILHKIKKWVEWWARALGWPIVDVGRFHAVKQSRVIHIKRRMSSVRPFATTISIAGFYTTCLSTERFLINYSNIEAFLGCALGSGDFLSRSSTCLTPLSALASAFSCAHITSGLRPSKSFLWF